MIDCIKYNIDNMYFVVLFYIMIEELLPYQASMSLGWEYGHCEST